MMSQLSDDLIQKINNYTTPPAAVDLIKNTSIALLVGATGAGKDTVIQKLLETGKYYYIVSHTTRAPRENAGQIEQDGHDYYFVEPAEIERLIDGQAFIEAKVNHRSHVYATSVAELQKSHDQHLIATSDVDVKGVSEYKKIDDTVHAVFLLPPNFDEWMKRILARGDQDQEVIKRRLQTAEEELEHAIDSGHFSFVVNDELDQTVARVRAITEEDQYSEQDHKAGQELAWQLLNAVKRELHS